MENLKKCKKTILTMVLFMGGICALSSCWDKSEDETITNEEAVEAADSTAIEAVDSTAVEAVDSTAIEAPVDASATENE